MRFQISQILVQNELSAPHAGVSGGVDRQQPEGIVARLAEILKECDYKDLTCGNIRAKLEREFGPKAVASVKKCISVAVVHELNARREASDMTSALLPKRELKQELRRAMNAACKQRYNLTRELSVPDENFEGSEIVWAVRLIKTLKADVETCRTLQSVGRRGTKGGTL